MYYFYYFPLGTETRLQRRPVVTILLVTALVVVHYLLNYFKPTVHLFWDMVLRTDQPNLLQAFTACFVHGGLFHLAGNLLYLGTFGPALEDRIGRWAMLGFYLVAGMVSMLVQVEIYRHSVPGGDPILVLGASGAISGLLGLFLVRAWFLKVRIAHATFAYLRATTHAGVLALPAWVAVGGWTLLQAVYSLVYGHGGGGTAYWAHLSGLVLGVAVGLLTRQGGSGLRERRLIQGRRYFDRGDYYAAMGEFQGHTEVTGGTPEGLLGEARCHHVLRRRADALDAYDRAFVLLAQARRWPEAADTVAEIKRLAPGFIPSPRHYQHLALHLEQNDDVLRAVDAYERLGRFHPEADPAARAWSRAARLARDVVGDLRRASVAYAAAAERLEEEFTDAFHRDRARSLRKRSEDCRRVHLRRLGVTGSKA